MNITKYINILLICAALLLVINLFHNFTGNTIYVMDKEEPICNFSNQGQINTIPFELCCYYLENQLACDNEGNFFQCYVSKNTGKSYIINYKELTYCRKEGYNVKVS